MRCELELGTGYYEEEECDGCGKVMLKDEKRIRNIQSCCGGGCDRQLCVSCVEAAYILTR